MIEPQFAECRVYGHRWDSIQIAFDVTFYVETMKCDVCGAERYDFVNKSTGFTVTRQYKYPTGYQQKGGVPRAEIGDMRLQIMQERATKSRKKAG